jgi:hypothetical protein
METLFIRRGLMATDVPLGTLRRLSLILASSLQSIAYEARLIGSCRAFIASNGRGAVIVLLMIGVLACLLFLCVSPLISHLASRKPESAPPSKSRLIQKQPIQKQTFSAR